MINKNFLVSIMIPTYNQDKYIKRAIDSALNQTYENIEVIISDDSTNNKTEKLIENNYSNNKKVRYIHNIPSKGKTKNYRYMLYNLVNGKYVVNLDGDDYFEDENFILDAVNLINKYQNIIMVVAQQKILKIKKNKFIFTANNKINKKVIDGKKIFLDSVFKNFEIPHLATLYRVDIAKKIGFYEYDIPSTDRESLLKLALYGEVGILNKVVAVWVHHGDNISQNVTLEILLENIKMYDRLYEYAKNNSNINSFLLKIWNILAKYKSFYGYINTLRDKNTIKKIINSEYKIYGYLLKLDPRLKKVLN